MDTAGQAAALTGGYGNSYAQTAGQQTYNQYLLGLTQLVPQYQQMALEQYRLERKTVSEIPSNKTDYDRDYELGSAQMRWYFFNEDWQTAIGAEDITSTFASIFHCESNDGHKSLVAEDSFWLEKLVDGKWQYVDENKTSVSVQKQSVDVMRVYCT